MLRLTRGAVAATVTLILCACGGGGGGSVFNPNPGPVGYAACDPGTSVTIARPQSGSYNVPTTIGSIEIVTSGSDNAVAANPSAWTIALQSGYNGQIVTPGGNLTVASDPNGPHPYQSDYYFAQGIGQLQAGTQYNVYIEQTFANCTPVQIGQFST